MLKLMARMWSAITRIATSVLSLSPYLWPESSPMRESMPVKTSES